MAIVVLRKSPTKTDISKAREEYRQYLKITVDLSQKLVAMGGEYHADAEKMLLDNFGSKQEDVWGGGYNLLTQKFETIAIINIRQNSENQSMEIINPEIRSKFLKVVKEKLKDIKSLL